MYLDACEHALGDVRIGLGPGVRRRERIEFREDQAAGTAGRAWIGRIDRGHRARHDQAAVGEQRVNASEMSRPRRAPPGQSVRRITTDDCVQHAHESPGAFGWCARLASQAPCANANTRTRPSVASFQRT